MEVVAERPAFLDEDVAKLLDVGDDARAFLGADVEPDRGMRVDARGGGETIDDALIPPDRRRERGDFAEGLRELEAEVKRDEAAERRTADAGETRIGVDAILRLDERHHFLQQKFCVAIGAAAAEFWRFGGCVLEDARFACVVDADDDERRKPAGADAVVGGALDVPVLSGKGCGAVEKILAVVKIEDGEAAIGLIVVAGREIDDEVALIAEKARTEIIVFAKLAVVHGTICTSRSLASTCCPCVTRSFATFPEIVA